MEDSKQQDAVSEHNLPEWETTARHRGEKQPPTARPGLKHRVVEAFERAMPAHQRYCGLTRKVAYIVIRAIVVVILILIIGLAAGLSEHSRSVLTSFSDICTLVLTFHRSHHQNLPLGSKTYTGDFTYYGPGLGACGVGSSDSDNIVSISHIVFDAASTGSDPNANPLCKHMLRAVRDGDSIDLTVVDRCTFQAIVYV